MRNLRPVMYLFFLAALLVIFSPALSSRAQDSTPPAILAFSADRTEISLAEVEAGDQSITFTYQTVGMTEGYTLALQEFQINQWVTLTDDPEELPAPKGEITANIRHSLDFGAPRYRLLIVRAGTNIVGERTWLLTYTEPDEPADPPTIATFTAATTSLSANALAYENATITVSWQIDNRLPSVNPVFEQLLEDGTAVVVELPRFNRWIPSSGTGPLAPVLPENARRFELQLSLVDLATGTLYDSQQIEITVTGTLATPTPAPTARPRATAAPVTNDNSSNPPPVVRPGAGGGFELGGHVLGYGKVNEMRAAGMTWVKKQLRWRRGEGVDGAASLINAARANGFKVLLGIVGYKDDMGDFNAYVNEFAAYLGQVASLGPDAIEVWNEPNIDREWPNGTISGANYTRLLAAAYNTIKSANANVMVISGAPAPTGFFGGCAAAGCDDNVFLRQMANAGAAQYMDCAGAHYNEGIISPDQRSGDPRGGHYSRYFYGMLDLYSGAFGRPVCWTELGYLSGEGWGELPSFFAWASTTTLAQHAEWLGRAASLSRASGRVRLMIVWNVDFTDVRGNDPQGGYAIVRPDGSCPACGQLAAALQ